MYTLIAYMYILIADMYTLIDVREHHEVGAGVRTRPHDAGLKKSQSRFHGYSVRWSYRPGQQRMEIPKPSVCGWMGKWLALFGRRAS